MKKIVVALMAMLTLSLGACSQNKENKIENKKESKEMKTLVTYFSASGVTAKVAKDLAEAAGADLAEIQPEVPYTDADLDWTNKKSRSSVEMNDKNSRPAINKMTLNVEDYDVIFVGFPIWWYTAPTIINTFMESANFAGKTVVPFATSGGSDIRKACDDLKAAYPDVNWKPGRLLNRASKDELVNWVNGIK